MTIGPKPIKVLTMISPLIVQKYGGSSLATAEHIRSIAKKISKASLKGNKLIIVVSAMGNTTNTLIDLARQVSTSPDRRELDMLLSTGERVSQALMSMALRDHGISSISFTGSQAGILTDNSHSHALLVDLKPVRVTEELEKNNVVVVAGFQGVNPHTKEITTLGRGGSDLTAVAFATHYKAKSCEILKDVEGVFSADPKIVPQARQIPKLNYPLILEMTFWGSKVLHYRAVELAASAGLTLRVGLAHGDGLCTIISTEDPMLEQNKVVSVNSHNEVRKIVVQGESLGKALSAFHQFLKTSQIPWPQILDTNSNQNRWEFLVTAPSENIGSLESQLSKNSAIRMEAEKLSTVTATCYGSVETDFSEKVSKRLEEKGIETRKMLMSAMSLTAVVKNTDRTRAIEAVHSLIS